MFNYSTTPVPSTCHLIKKEIKSINITLPISDGTKDNFIPWKMTSSGINALNAITKFYFWLPS